MELLDEVTVKKWQRCRSHWKNGPPEKLLSKENIEYDRRKP
jgi:hypothetical protein